MFGKAIAIRMHLFGGWHVRQGAAFKCQQTGLQMSSLDAFCSCRHVDVSVCVDAEEVAVVGGVVESAQCQAIADLRDAGFLGVGDDV